MKKKNKSLKVLLSQFSIGLNGDSHILHAFMKIGLWNAENKLNEHCKQLVSYMAIINKYVTELDFVFLILL